jgi:hypothetical protein
MPTFSPQKYLTIYSHSYIDFSESALFAMKNCQINFQQDSKLTPSLELSRASGGLTFSQKKV